MDWRWCTGAETQVNFDIHAMSRRKNDIKNNRYFRDQPLTHPDVTDQYLLLWYFEDWLKKYFFAILQLLEVGLIYNFLLMIYSHLCSPGFVRGSTAVCSYAGDESNLPIIVR